MRSIGFSQQIAGLIYGPIESRSDDFGHLQLKLRYTAAEEIAGGWAVNETSENSEYTAAVARFAEDLGALRLEKDLTLEALAHSSRISRSVVADALKGEKLPTVRTVAAIARACDQDPKEFLSRRSHVARLQPAKTPPVDSVPEAPRASEVVPEDPVTGVRKVPWWWLLVACAGGAALALASVLVLPALTHGTAPEDAIVASGQDPADTECIDDAKVAASKTHDDNYFLEILYSDRCDAAWARVTRSDGLATGNMIVVRLYPQNSPDSVEAQTATEYDVQSAYTTLIVRPTPKTLLCADGFVSINGRHVSLGEPICT